ncbi:HAD-IA family hydrolase [Shewanella dokdonensis]|uniref:HAD-IA family hydrolase n=1 Tax=Shewanella dokdonensis TaxID=712036 RepID=A0ABX8DF62_9GAMM|nr:HAD-IA family hydrolase [Shewanella dokdonensis]MCL1074911.1 HAD-IA family hydrolase [Shewanella dokdonensis]QVK23363.1 HAD-IA family hydrolase [Shewanella dokdonensis]
MKHYDLIIFDWDGTLMDSIGRILACLRNVASDMGLLEPSEAAQRDIIGMSLAQAMQTLFPGRPAQEYPLMQQSYRNSYQRQAHVATPLYAGITELLTQLQQQHYQLAVATGKSRPGLDRSLQQTGLDRFFQLSRCADEAHSKPHPDMLQQILAHTGVSAARALMVGDSVLDLQMANAAGVAAVGVSYGAHSREQLQLHRPKAIISEPLALLSVLTA